MTVFLISEISLCFFSASIYLYTKYFLINFIFKKLLYVFFQCNMLVTWIHVFAWDDNRILARLFHARPPDSHPLSIPVPRERC